MKKLLTLIGVTGTLVIAGNLPTEAKATVLPGNEGGGSGGYTQLPACGPSFYGITLYVQGYAWRCAHATPDHWVIV